MSDGQRVEYLDDNDIQGVAICANDDFASFACHSRMGTPIHRLPSFDLLRGFVAVGRRLSFSKAAEDLCVTQSAVSRQIALLESQLGCTLFERGHRCIWFTEDGTQLFRKAEFVIGELDATLSRLSGRSTRRTVTITASLGVSSLWLLPRLGQLYSEFPDLDVRVVATNKWMDMGSEGVDLAIRYGILSEMPRDAVYLFAEATVPVCHPSLGSDGLDLPDLLRTSTLIEYDDPGRAWLRWDAWLREFDLHAAMARAVIRFNQYDQVIQAATAGQGIAIGRVPLIRNFLADGRLRTIGEPDTRTLPARGYFVIRSRREQRAEVIDVLKWLGNQGGKSIDMVGSEPFDEPFAS
jgi:DNA-binding transcriptional LysR family regulator